MCSLPGEDYFFCFSHAMVVYSYFCRVEALWSLAHLFGMSNL